MKLAHSASAKKYWMVGLALFAWFGIILQYILNIQFENGISAANKTVRFFSYFTILTNILCALSVTIPLFQKNSKAGRLFLSPFVQSGITVFIVVVGLVYHFLLRNLWNPQGVQWLADIILHYIDPLLYLIFWFLFTPSKSIQFRHAFVWLLYPVVYFIWILIAGLVTKFYPYPFVDVASLGYVTVFKNALLLMVAFTVLGFVIVLINRRE